MYMKFLHVLVLCNVLLIIALFKSLGSKHIHSVPSGLCRYVIDETHYAGADTGVVICRSSMC